MQILLGFLLLLFLAFLSASFLHGLANTLDLIALKIHRSAKSLREMQRRRSNQMEENWVREIERPAIVKSNWLAK